MHDRVAQFEWTSHGRNLHANNLVASMSAGPRNTVNRASCGVCNEFAFYFLSDCVDFYHIKQFEGRDLHYMTTSIADKICIRLFRGSTAWPCRRVPALLHGRNHGLHVVLGRSTSETQRQTHNRKHSGREVLSAVVKQFERCNIWVIFLL